VKLAEAIESGLKQASASGFGPFEFFEIHPFGVLPTKLYSKINFNIFQLLSIFKTILPRLAETRLAESLFDPNSLGQKIIWPKPHLAEMAEWTSIRARSFRSTLPFSANFISL
jgi:hypothetical protein